MWMSPFKMLVLKQSLIIAEGFVLRQPVLGSIPRTGAPETAG
jgi:hypothetical protein